MQRLLKPLLFVLLAMPAAALVYGLFSATLGPNPVETITHSTGEWALRMLLVTLAVTPIRKLTGASWVMRVRRMLGLYAFFYACLHVLTYLVLDAEFSLAYVVEDVVKRAYITVGFAAFLVLIPLAATSNHAMMRRLGGRRWQALHRAAYVATFAALLHFLWLVKADVREPLIHIAVFVLLMLMRVPAISARLPRLRSVRTRNA